MSVLALMAALAAPPGLPTTGVFVPAGEVAEVRGPTKCWPDTTARLYVTQARSWEACKAREDTAHADHVQRLAAANRLLAAAEAQGRLVEAALAKETEDHAKTVRKLNRQKALGRTLGTVGVTAIAVLTGMVILQ